MEAIAERIYSKRRDLKTFVVIAGVGLDRDAAGESLLGLPHGVGRGPSQRSRDLRGDNDAPSPAGLSPRGTAQRAQRLVRDRDRSLDESAAGARLEQCLAERAAAARPHQLEMSEPGPAEQLRACRFGSDRCGERRAYLVARRPAGQPDKIDDEAASEIAQPDLPGDGPGGGEVGHQPAALRRPRFRSPRIHVDQHAGPGRLEMYGTAAGEGERSGQRLVEYRVEIDRPLGFRQVRDGAARKSGAEFGNGRRVVHENLVGRPRQRPGERGGKGRHRVEPGWGIELPSSFEGVIPPRYQSLHLIPKRDNGSILQEPEPRRTLTRLAALGTLSRSAGEGGPSPHGSAQSAARGQAPGWVGEGRE